MKHLPDLELTEAQCVEARRIARELAKQADAHTCALLGGSPVSQDPELARLWTALEQLPRWPPSVPCSPEIRILIAAAVRHAGAPDEVTDRIRGL